ncbi:MAG: alpha/beta fold hydrolase [Bdellovibrionales bacterium]|nr:alpha/beta fold hydrolase [Bdellovibrionales bacterium]
MAHQESNLSSVSEAYSLICRDSTKARGSVVLFHGLTGTPAEMRGLATSLHNMNFNVIVPRLSGHGETIEALRTVSAQVWRDEARRAADEAAALGGPLSFAGLSFGGLLALDAAAAFPRCASLVLMSVPTFLEPCGREFWLRVLSYLPDVAVDRLWLKNKTKRREGYLALAHHAYSKHSVGAAVRLVQIRRSVFKTLGRLRCPVLIFQDPLDHHLPPTASLVLQDYLVNSDSTLCCVPDGQHELLLGHKHQFVIERSSQFIDANSVD